MPSPLRDPKTLPEWIELDYYKRSSRLRRVRRWAIVAVFVVGVAVMAVTFWPRTHWIYQAGPVASAHASFNQDCTRCHEEHFQPAFRLWPTNASHRSVRDDACRQCHDGALHNEQQVSKLVPGCAGCHQEHRGRAFLAQVPNGHCTSCHADLKRQDGARPDFRNVTAFATDHPEFADLMPAPGEQSPRDRANIYFNHEKHLGPEGVKGAGGILKKLDCAYCHAADPVTARRYMQPINYDRHCKDCHPLSVQVVGVKKTDEAHPDAEAFNNHPAPHPRRDAAEVRAALWTRLALFVQDHPTVVGPGQTGAVVRPLPGRTAPFLPEKPAAWVEDQLRQAERVLFTGAAGCGYCHVPEEVDKGRKALDLPQFKPTNIPRRWFDHGRFNHDSHRSVTCTACHEKAATSSRTSDVLLPGIDSCKQCHNPKVGVRHDCIDCHQYHDRDREAPPKKSSTIEQFLRGSGHP